MPDLHLTAPLTITRGLAEYQCEARGVYVPYQPATRESPAEGGYLEDVQVFAFEVSSKGAFRSPLTELELCLTDSELQQAERALREAIKHHTDCED